MATADGPKLAAAVTRADEASIAETTPATSLAPFAAVVPRLLIVAGAQTTADSRPASATPGPKATVFPSRCASRAWFGWRTIAQQSLPLLSAAAPFQRRAASMQRFSLPAPAPKATRRGRARQPSRQRAPTEPQNAVATPKNKKAQKSARGQNHRRDQYRYGAPSWREVRVDDWAARGYAPRERDYQRGAYGRGGFTPNFW
jgi:hypothetical protein